MFELWISFRGPSLTWCNKYWRKPLTSPNKNKLRVYCIILCKNHFAHSNLFSLCMSSKIAHVLCNFKSWRNQIKCNRQRIQQQKEMHSWRWLERILWFTAIAPLVLIREEKIKFHAAPGLNGACGDASHSFFDAYMCVLCMLNGLPNTQSAWRACLVFFTQICIENNEAECLFVHVCAWTKSARGYSSWGQHIYCAPNFMLHVRAAANSDRKRGIYIMHRWVTRAERSQNFIYTH